MQVPNLVYNLRMYLEDLPSDILREIFYMHVYLYRQSRKPLLQTCRRWYTVATSDSLLWRSFSLYNRGEIPQINIECQTLQGLAQIVNRTGTATFDFRLGCPNRDPSDDDIQLFIRSVEKNWLSRCRSFTLLASEEPWRTPDSNVLGDLLKQYSYESLQHVELNHTGTKMWEHMLESLMDRVEYTSPNLRSLKIKCGVSVTEIRNSVLQRPSVLKRIRRLSIDGIDEPFPWADFQNLEELDFSNTNKFNLSDLTEVTVPRLRRLTLRGDYQPDEIPSKILHPLTHLTLDTFTIAGADVDYLLALPSLVSLTFLSTDFDLACFDAPKLEEFNFRTDPYDGRPYAYPWFEEATISPRVVHLDTLSDMSEKRLNEPYNIWKRVEELNITSLKDAPLTWMYPMNALSEEWQQCFPALRSLTLLHSSSIVDGGPHQEEKEEAIVGARAIMEERVAAGLKPLERLQVGWYWTNDNCAVLEDQSREWWVTMWEDCLPK